MRRVVSLSSIQIYSCALVSLMRVETGPRDQTEVALALLPFFAHEGTTILTHVSIVHHLHSSLKHSTAYYSCPPSGSAWAGQALLQFGQRSHDFSTGSPQTTHCVQFRRSRVPSSSSITSPNAGLDGAAGRISSPFSSPSSSSRSSSASSSSSSLSVSVATPSSSSSSSGPSSSFGSSLFPSFAYDDR